MHAQLHVNMLLSTCQVFYYLYSSIILNGLWDSIGVTRSPSSHPFLCALAQRFAWGKLEKSTQESQNV